ncbi:MAG: hypothetical protein ABJB74_23215 [Gemmatimonas sp.]
MTFTLFRRYIAEPRLIMMSVMVASMFAFMGDAGILVALLTPIVSIAVVPSRASLFEVALPISARAIICARLMAACVFSVTPLIVWWVALQTSSAQRMADILPEMTGLRPLGNFDRIGLCALVIVCATLPYVIRANEMKRPSVRLLLAAYGALLALSALVLFALPSQIASVALVVSAVGVFALVFRNAPESLQVTSLRLENASKSSRAQSAVSADNAKYWWLAVARALLSPRWFFFGVLLAFQSALGNWTWTIGIQFSMLPFLRQRTAWLGAFPISARVRLLLTLVPVLVGSFGAIVIGGFVGIPGLPYKHMNPITWQSVSMPLEPGPWYSSPTRIKLMYWEFAPNGQPPVITAPFGESVSPDTLRVPVALMYNPYTTNRKSSDEFIEWQYARAAAKVYGHPVPRPQSYEEGKIFPQPLYEAPRVQLLNASALLCLVLFLYFLTEFGRYRAPAGRGPLQHIGDGVAPVLGILAIMIDGFYGVHHTTQIVVPLAKRWLLHLSDALPGNIVVVALLALLPPIAMYALLEWQVARTEMSPVPIPKKA